MAGGDRSNPENRPCRHDRQTGIGFADGYFHPAAIAANSIPRYWDGIIFS
jgi:hypothetical protein